MLETLAAARRFECSLNTINKNDNRKRCLFQHIKGRVRYPYLQQLFALVSPGGFLLYETFGVGNEIHGKPSNPDFLLEPGELAIALGSSFEIIDERFEEDLNPSSAVRAGVFARRIR